MKISHFSDKRVWASVLSICLLGLIHISQAQTSHEESVGEHNKAIVQHAFDVWIDGKGSPFDLLADDATWTITGHSLVSGAYSNKADFMNQVIRPFNARISGKLVPTVQSIFVDGDTVIVLFDGATIARDGKPYRNTYAWILQMKNNEIIHATAFFDSIAFDDLWQRVRPVSAP